MSAVSLDDSLLDFDNVSVVTGGSQISKTTLLNAQRQDPTIGKVLKFKESGRWPSPWERRRESPATRVLLRQRSKLYLGKDGLLYRNSGTNAQLLLPKCFHSTVFSALSKSWDPPSVSTPLSLLISDKSLNPVGLRSLGLNEEMHHVNVVVKIWSSLGVVSEN